MGLFLYDGRQPAAAGWTVWHRLVHGLGDLAL